MSTISGPLGTIEEQAGIENENGQTLIHANIRLGDEYIASLPLTCKLQAASLQFSMIAGLMWTLCFSIHLFRISMVNVNTSTHSYTSFFIYLCFTISIPAFLTYYIFAKNLVGVSSDFWCWIKSEHLNDWALKMFYIEMMILIVILFVLYFALKCHLKRFVTNTQNVALISPQHNADANDPQNMEGTLSINLSRLSFVHTVNSLSTYLLAPFIAFFPAHFNIICSATGLESDEHVLTWYVLSAILLGIMHVGIYVCGIAMVRNSWTVCCDGCRRDQNNAESENDNAQQQQPQSEKESKKEFIRRSLEQSNKLYMELV
eukprot:CAMPEP_0202694968 /NCGR_PEP_ID=MMETSP1385-20130828/8684_1 /ASSEMBLY_ACC=CAM_ASM_000861 /TAXON_ID=933848 /ORGANISM="Elphidium margaritaceum" /LENGTH=316 /DNA_ID=CAMNT_0049350913 /DNA_START=226 /DNA_END=1176 /DNA_ORIENTATION=+